jgi:hypothetical protein
VVGASVARPNATSHARPRGGHSVFRGLATYICYIDEAGGFEAPGSSPGATPLIAGLIVPVDRISLATEELLDIKRTFYPGRCPNPRSLDHILVEVV